MYVCIIYSLLANVDATEQLSKETCSAVSYPALIDSDICITTLFLACNLFVRPYTYMNAIRQLPVTIYKISNKDFGESLTRLKTDKSPKAAIPHLIV